MRTGYDVDVAVIGSGMIGSACALAVAANGRQVTVIDPNLPGAGTAIGSGGYIHDGEIFPLAEPGIVAILPKLLMDPLGPLVIRASYLPELVGWGARFVQSSTSAKLSHSIASLASLNRLSVDSIAALASTANAGHLIAHSGGLKVIRDKEILRVAAIELEQLRHNGIRAETIDMARLREMEPSVSADMAGAIFFPNSAHCVDTEKFSEYLGAMVQANCRYIRAKATKLETKSGAWVIFANSGMRICARKVVVAAGAWSAPLLKGLGYSVPVATVRGYHLMLPRPNVALQRPIIFFEPHIGATPMAKGLRLAGTVEFAQADAPVNFKRATMLYDIGKKYLPGLTGEGATTWMGVRSLMPDSLPAIGPAHRHTNLFYCFGHGHLGMTQAAISARCIADLVAENQPPIDLNPFSLSRFKR